jgi:hypothetical protein
MGYKKFLVPVTAAIAALFSNTAQAITPPSGSVAHSPAPVRSTLAAPQSTEANFHMVNYQVGTEEHALIMRKSVSGLMYADHYSHSSHGSHSSHSSHRSGY